MPTVLVWDLETVPDLEGYARANGLKHASPDEARKAIGDEFPKHIYHSIVCIGALLAERSANGWSINVIGAPSVADIQNKRLGSWPHVRILLSCRSRSWVRHSLRVRECVYGAELELQTLIWTRGRDFPLTDAGEPLDVSTLRIAAGTRCVQRSTGHAASSGTLNRSLWLTAETSAQPWRDRGPMVMRMRPTMPRRQMLRGTGAHFHFARGKARIDVTCSVQEDTEACVRAAGKLIDKIAKLRSGGDRDNMSGSAGRDDERSGAQSEDRDDSGESGERM